MTQTVWDNVPARKKELETGYPNIAALFKRMPFNKDNADSQETGTKLQGAMSEFVFDWPPVGIKDSFAKPLNDALDSETSERIIKLATEDPAALNRAMSDIVKNPAGVSAAIKNIRPSSDQRHVAATPPAAADPKKKDDPAQPAKEQDGPGTIATMMNFLLKIIAMIFPDTTPPAQQVASAAPSAAPDAAAPSSSPATVPTRFTGAVATASPVTDPATTPTAPAARPSVSAPGIRS